MSLNWDTTRCKRGELPDSDVESGWREALIWASIAVDLGEITEENASEWFARLKVLDHIGQGVLINWHDDDVMQALWRWEGLSTNVSDMTRKQWLSKQGEVLERNVMRHAASQFQTRVKEMTGD